MRRAKLAHPVRYWLGKKRSLKTIHKIRIAKKGSIPWNKGRHGIYSTETLAKIGLASSRRRAEKSANWKGGKPLCIDCGKVIFYKKKRCRSCDLRRKHSLRGPRARTWKGGVTPTMLIIRHCQAMRKWRIAIFTRDNYICRICAKRGGLLHADHYPRSFASIIHKYQIRTLEDALKCKPLWNIRNGRTLCAPCHRKRHKSKKVE